MGKRDVIHKTESAYHIATLSGENGALATVRMQKKIQWSVEAWFLRYTGEPTDRQTDSTVAILRCPTGAKIKCSKVVRTYESLRACRRRTGRQARPTQTSSASLRVPSWSGVRCCSGHEFYRRFPAGNRWTRVRLRSGELRGHRVVCRTVEVEMFSSAFYIECHRLRGSAAFVSTASDILRSLLTYWAENIVSIFLINYLHLNADETRT